MLKGKNIVLGVCGGIAVYKACDLVSQLKKMGANIDIIMTKSATEFVTELTFRTLSANPVVTDMFDSPTSWDVKHISLAQKADLFLIVPATANIIGKISNAIADDMLSTTVMATKAPVILCPAMNTGMYENPLVQENIKKLKNFGYEFIEPQEGRLACGDIGKGKLAKIETIISYVEKKLYDKKDLKNKTVLVTAGPTIESIDPVRYITNRSSGKMGYALANKAALRGAKVILISGKTNLVPSENIQECIFVESAREMYNKVLENFNEADIVIKSAAVADYKPKAFSNKKIKKSDSDLKIDLDRNPDILKELGSIKGSKVLVGFAAETNDLIENAKSKIERKNLDFIVANDLSLEGAGFAVDTNIVKIIEPDGRILELPKISKQDLADKILDKALEKSNSKK